MTTDKTDTPGRKALGEFCTKEKITTEALARLLERKKSIGVAWRHGYARPRLGDMLILQKLAGIPVADWLTPEERARVESLSESAAETVIHLKRAR